MKKFSLVFSLCAAAVIGLFSTAQGAQINGGLTFAGTVTLDVTSAGVVGTNSLGNATKVTAWHYVGSVGNPYVGSASGDFIPFITLGPPGTVILAAPWSFNSGPVPNFWQVGGFTFNLTSSSIVQQDAKTLAVTGSGVVTGNGFDPTPGVWSFTSQAPSAQGVFSFSASTIEMPCAGQIGDFVWRDDNGNGCQDPGEPGIPNVQVDLYSGCGPNANLVQSQVTDVNGAYHFTGLCAGDYTVSFHTPAGYQHTLANQNCNIGGQPPTATDSNCACTGTTSPCPVCVTLTTDSSTDLTIDCGYIPLRGSIGDTVYCDTNNNGVQDPGETGIPGVTVRLYAGNNCTGVPLDTKVTDSLGKYLFTNLLAGDYCVQVDQTTAPPGCNGSDCPTTVPVSLAAGQMFLDADFCFTPPPGSIGDTVYCDTNGNGVQDPGETGIPGVIVRLYAGGNCTGTPLRTATTDANGKYLFSNLPAGSYCVQADQTTAPAGCNTTDCPSTVSVTLAAGQAFLDADFCFKPPPGSIGDTVYCDTNGNGVQDAGELGIPGVTVKLYAGGNCTGTPLQTMVTDANGQYMFTNLIAGSYCVEVDSTTAPAGCNTSDCPTTVAVSLAAGQAFLDADFCFKPPPSSIGDTVYCDTNGNGVQDAGETGIPGVVVRLFAGGNCSGNPLQTATTDSNGHYLFSNLMAGSYCVQVDPTTAPAGCNNTDCPTSVTVGLAVGQNFLDADFCFKPPPSSIGDTVYCDTNGNGVQDAGETGIPGVTVRLYAGGNCTGTPLRTATTDANGKYLFSNLMAGSYCVQVDQGTAPAGCNNTDCPTSVTVGLAVGQNFLDADFCFKPPPSSIGDMVYCDTNGNGVQDAGETGIPGVTVRLYAGGNCTGTPLRTATTDSNGKYLFSNLMAGSYCVQVDPTTAPAGCNNTDCPTSVTVGLAVGQNFLDADFCFKPPPGSIGDTVYCDTNGNGVQDAGESGIPGVIVRLYAGGNCTGTPLRTATTDSNGKYLFANLMAGSYCVQVDQGTAPAGCNNTDCPTSVTVGLAVGQNFLDADFCFKPPPGSIGDTVYCDTNGNGVQDAGESGIPGVIVRLYAGGNCTGTPLQTATTDSNGKYLFSNLMAGSYCVQVDPTTAPADCNGSDCPTTVTVGLSAGQAFLDADFCFKPPPGSIGDTVYCDANGNGVQDAGELGIPGVTVRLFAGGNCTGTALRTAMTDSNGKYLFTNLIAGSYCVQVDQTTAPTGCNLTDCPLTVPVALAAGQVFLDADFCFTQNRCADGVLGGVDLSGLANNELFFFANGSQDANWQGATKGFAGNVLVNGIVASERTSGKVPFAGTIATNDTTLGAWENIVNQNSGQAVASYGNTMLISDAKAKLVNAIKQINLLPATTGYTSRSSTSLDGLNTTGNANKVFVINITSGLQVSSQIDITGDADQIFILRWDTDANPANGYQGQVKFQSGGAIVPHGGLKPSNFINVAGDINSSGGGSTPPPPYPQGPRLNNGTGALVGGATNFSGGGFFTGYWLTTGAPTTLDPATGLYIGNTAPQSNGIFVGGWYTLTDKFSMTSGTSGVYVQPNCP